jgi:dipeptidyl aminopeptidase/acylaminoacyl peptidase
MVAKCKPDGTFAGKPWDTLGIENPPSANEFCWTGSKLILFTVDNDGATVLYSSLPGIVGEETASVVGPHDRTGAFGTLSSDQTGEHIAFIRSDFGQPPEVLTARHNPINLSQVRTTLKTNEKLLEGLDLPKTESVSVLADGGMKMQMWVIKPPGFDEKKKWPVVYLVHGGPQSAWKDAWSYRWNPALWAAQGYVVVMPNPRGSVGFGQKFVDEITGDWGGKCYRDLVAGLDFVEKLPYVDKDRIAAAGGSFGGYMMNWFAVNDIAPRFKCLITHCSVWNFESMWGTTDELWFDEWEHGGLPWEKPQKYAEFSPHKKAANLAKYKTPMLIIHNDLDFRCPIGQGHELFTALQRQGVPSRFVNFPDEGHWVLKPKNSEHWHKEVFAWLKKYTPPGGK